MAHAVVCIRCEEPVKVRRKSSGTQLFGLLLLVVSLFFFWPAAIVGLLMMVFGGTKRVCDRCGGVELVPLDSLRAKRIIEEHVAPRAAARMAARVVCERCAAFGDDHAQCEHCGYGLVHPVGSPAANAILGRKPAPR